MNGPYDFLNEYLSKVSNDSGKSDPNVEMDDDSDFYNTISDQQQPEEDIQYGISQDEPQDEPQDESQDEQDDSSTDQPEENNDDQDMLDYLLGDQDPYSQAAFNESDDGDLPPAYVTAKMKSRGSGSLSDRISANESQGKYSAFNSKGGGGGAVGKYQFRWNIWKDSIQKVTGVKSKDEFLQSPEAQEKYFSWYEKHYLKPEAEKVQKYNKAGLSMDQLEELVHFRGVGGAKQYLQGKLKDKPESYNMSISKYIAKHQMGGMGGGAPVAMSAGAQHMGLNNGSFSEMVFPMEGVNTFRGLDDETPVYLEDEVGKKKILKGRHHKARMTGKVYEKRLK